MNGFEDLLRRDLQTSGLRIAFVVDVDPVVASGHRTIRRRVLTTSALGLVVAVVGGLVFRPGAVPPVAEPAPSVVASPSPAPTTSDGFAPSDPTPEPSATLDVARWATPSVDFPSPSTRLACAMRPDGVTCAIPMEFTGTVPEVDCVDGPGPATEVDLADGVPVYSCASDPAAFPGNALRLGDFMCSSAESGVTCTNTATGHAVKLNRQEIVLR